jgi:hypothetical protein
MEIISINKLGVEDAVKAQGQEKLNLLRSVRKDLLKAFDVYKTNVSFGILLQTELEIAVAKKWYEKLLDLNEDAFLDIPSQISKYL